MKDEENVDISEKKVRIERRNFKLEPLGKTE